MVTIHGGLCMYHRSQISSLTFDRFVLRQRVARIGVLEKYCFVCLHLGNVGAKSVTRPSKAQAPRPSPAHHICPENNGIACRILPQVILATGMKMRQIVLQRIQ
jgi:hypothetical protein